MTKRIVITDGFTWHTPTGINGLPRKHRALKGDEIDVDLATLNAAQLAALADPSDAATIEASQSDGWVQKTDDEIAGLSVEEIVAYLNSAPEDLHDSETERLVVLEEQGKQRKSVLALLGPVSDDED